MQKGLLRRLFSTMSNRFRTISIVFLTFLVVTVIVAIGLLAATPPVSRDALTHHLAVPKLYIEGHAIRELPDIVFSYYPMNLDLLFCIPLYFGNDILPKYIHFFFGLLTAWGIGVYLRMRFNLVYGLFGALLFLSTPVIVRLASTAYVDLGLCCFAFFALLFLLKWARKDGLTQHLVIAGVMCGLALGTKYNALVVFHILTLITAWLQGRRPLMQDGLVKGRRPASVEEDHWTASARLLGRSFRSASLFAIVALLVFSPWMVRNFIWTANPVYPLYDRLFNPNGQGIEGSSGEEILTDEQASLPPLVNRRLLYKEPFWYTALIPLRIFFEGRDDDPKHFDGKLNPFFLILPLVVLWGGRRRDRGDWQEDIIWFGFAGLLILFTFFTAAMRIRYIVAAVPSLVILSVSGIHYLASFSEFNVRKGGLKRAVTFMTIAFFIAMMGYNAQYIIDLYDRNTPIAYLSGELDRDSYILKHRPEYALYRYSNTHLKRGDKILGLFLGNRIYYSDIPMTMNENLILRISRDGSSASEIRAMLLAEGITYIMMQRDIFNFWINNNLDAAETIRLREFFKSSLIEIKASDGYSLYRIRSA